MKLVPVPKDGSKVGVDDPGKNIIFYQFDPTDGLAAGQTIDKLNYKILVGCFLTDQTILPQTT